MTRSRSTTTTTTLPPDDDNANKNNNKNKSNKTTSSSSSSSFRKSFSLLLSAQIVGKCLPFLFNARIFRRLKSEEIGKTLVEFPLAFALVLCVRDGLRRSLLRQEEEEERGTNDDDENENESARRLARRYIWKYACFVFALLMMFCFVWFWLVLLKRETVTEEEDQYRRAQSLLLCVLAALIELTTEPEYVWLQKKQIFGSRVVAETVGTFTKTAVLFYASLSSSSVYYAFAFAQVAQSFTTSAVYGASYYVHREKMKKAKKTMIMRKETQTTQKRRLINSFLYQSYLKLALAEGEKFALIVANANDSVMGVFGLVSNLGSLFVRLVLQPFEEVAYVTFAASASKEKKKEKLKDILSVSVLVGSIAFFVGPFFAKDVMYFLYGKEWMKDGTDTLQAYARLILPLSVNGIVEGFAHAVMSEREIKKQGNAWLVSCSLVNCVLGFSLLKYSRVGAAGLVYSNFVSLVLRIYLTSRFLIRRGKLSGEVLRETLPKPGTLVAIAASALALTTIEKKNDVEGMTPHLKHTVITGGSVAIVLLMTLFVCEKDRFSKVFRKGNRQKQE
jgi:oligosaccharide translocation protein RFT1